VRAVLDTNVIVSAILFGGVPRDVLGRGTRGEFTIITSPALLLELEGVLVRKFGFRAAEARAARGEIELIAAVVEPAALDPVARDRDDDEVLATAAGGSADMIVTGDRDLLDLDPYGRIEILDARVFVKRLRAASGSG
jgi:putative PIN family toxin of toxin-antitoxin system